MGGGGEDRYMASTTGNGLLDALRGGLIVSCQSNPGEAFHDATSMAKFAASARSAGAVGIRAHGLDDVAQIHEQISLPLIGLWKTGDVEAVFITPTLDHAVAIARAGAEIVAIDGTRRPRPDGRTLGETVSEIHGRTHALVMADVATVADGIAAASAGVDMISTALSGYTPETRGLNDGPDFDLVATLTDVLGLPVFAEGRIRTPEQAAQAIDLGAHAVVVGTAITHPRTISSWFVDALSSKPAMRLQDTTKAQE